jgi:hypothetical protein
MKTCDGCKSKQYTEEEKMMTIPYIAHQSAAARQERQIRRMWIALLIAISLVFTSNAIWLYAWTQYDYSSEEIIYQQDGQGTNVIGDSNEVNNGTEDNNS